jgi:cyanophycinase
MRRWRFLVLPFCLGLLVSLPNFRVNADEKPRTLIADPPRQPKGALLIAGGGVRNDNQEVWKRLIQLASDYARQQGEPPDQPPRIAVLPTAAWDPRTIGERAAASLRLHGAEAFVVPIALLNSPIDHSVAVRDPEILRQIRSAHGIYFTGGQQSRIVQVLTTAEQQQTPALQAIWDVYDAGGVIAGSSAGAAVMSQVMCREMGRQLNVLENGITHGKETSSGLGFLPADWFVDQHFLIRGRLARALVVTRHHQLPHGLGIDENTALVVRQNETEVIGYKGALWFDLTKASSQGEEPGFNIRNVRLSYLDRGDRLNMQTLELTPAPEKQKEPVIDPTSPQFEPGNDEPIFTTEILGNTTFLDVMRRLMNNKNDHAIGLAFDAQAARKGPVPAYEFRFYRDSDTRAWPPGVLEDYTISNVHLDVRRVEFAGISYR